MSLEDQLSFRALALGPPFLIWRSSHVTQPEHGLCRVLALGLPNSQVLYVALEEHVLLWVLALRIPDAEELIRESRGARFD